MLRRGSCLCQDRRQHPRRPPRLGSSRCSSRSAIRLAVATGEWDVVGHPYTTNAGKNVHVRMRRVDQPDVTQIRSWGAHERITVRRA